VTTLDAMPKNDKICDVYWTSRQRLESASKWL